MKFLLTLPLVASLFLHAQAQPERVVHVVAAADLQPVMPALVAAFEHATPIKIVVSYGSSATLATQLLNGEPADLFLGADFTFPEKIVAANLADTKSPIAYAKGTLVLWARKDSPFQPLHLDALKDPRLKSLAIANESHAPYGRAATSALHYLKLYEALAPRLVIGESIAQTSQFVESGNAQLGLLSLTTALSPHFQQLGTYILIPRVAYPKIVQYGVILKAAANRPDAHAFLDWLTSPPIQANLPRYGLEPVR